MEYIPLSLCGSLLAAVFAALGEVESGILSLLGEEVESRSGAGCGERGTMGASSACYHATQRLVLSVCMREICMR
jgi:hypothetical protein